MNKFCFSCGLIRPPAVNECPRCGDDYTLPAGDTSPSVGRRIVARSALRQHAGLLLDKRADGSLELLIDGELKTVRGRRVQQLDSDVDAPTCAAHRLWVAAAHVDDGVDTWKAVLEERFSDLLQSLSERRALARSAVRLCDEDAVAAAGLSAAETNWLVMWCRHNANDQRGALEVLTTLPPDGYPDKVGVIAAAWDVLVEDRQLRELARHQLEGVTGEMVDLLNAALGGHVNRQLIAVPRAPGVSFAHADVDGLVAVAAARSSGRVQDLDGRARDLCAVAYALENGAWPESAAPGEESLTGLTPAALDDLIDAHLVGPQILDHLDEQDESGHGYLRARLVPNLLSNEELASCDHAAERARRQFLSGEAVVASPDDPAYQFLMLDRLRKGDQTVLGDLVPMLSGAQQHVAIAVGASLRDQRIHPDALVDVSTWSVLAPLIVDGPLGDDEAPSVQRLREWWALEQGRSALYSWDLDGAQQHARECLRTSNDEDLRDEALNLLACALLERGDPEAASRALEEALEGADSPELIINYGIAAAEHDRLAAATELARLAMEAPTLNLRITAAERALLLWHTRVPGLSDEADEPPEQLIHAIRSLSVEPTTLTEHIDVMRFLSWCDGDWAADARHTAASPHVDSSPHRYLTARAKGPADGASELARLLRAQPNDEWLVGEREELVEGLISFLLENYGEAASVALWALEVADAGLAGDSRQRILLPILGVRELCKYMISDDSSDGILKRELFEKVRNARKLLKEDSELDVEVYGQLIDSAVVGVAITCWDGWTSEFNAIVEAHNSIVSQTSGMLRWQINRPAVRQATMPMIAALNEIDEYVSDVLPELNDPEIAAELDGLQRSVADLRTSVAALAR